jgi:hypothetical protein
MNAIDQPLSHDPAPKRPAMRLHESFFALFGGPMAWFAQLNAGFALASQPCFLNGERTLVPPWAADWTWPSMIALMIIACTVALLSTLIAWRAYARTDDEAADDHCHIIEAGNGRMRFLALWGILLGAGSALATASTAVAFFVLPRCAG